MNKILVHNGVIVNEDKKQVGSILIEDGKIAEMFNGTVPASIQTNAEIIDANGKIIIPGIIDDQVHFREPGLTHKGDIYTESRAAIAGGITSFMEMPNTNPQTITQKLLEEKYFTGSQKSLANYSFYIGATNTNLQELLKTDPKTVCGIKIFMGSSTGDMLVDNPDTLEALFRESQLLIAVHSEDEATIKRNLSAHILLYGENIPIESHPVIRSEEACFLSSSLAVKLAKKHNTRLHILHLSTAKELDLLSNAAPIKEKRITSEVCVHHLWFDKKDYFKYGSRIKWNPAIKNREDKEKLLEAVNNNTIDIIATDHAPHTLEEKSNTYLKAPSGGPLVQHSLNVMLELYHQKKITLEKIVQKMCHHPAEIFKVKDRGYIRKGYYADLAIIDLTEKWTVNTNNILYKCKWSPFEEYTFTGKVKQTIVNGNIVFNNGNIIESTRGMRLEFDR